MRLPISPPGQADNGNTLTNARGGVTVPVHKVRCTAAKVLKALINGSEASSREPALGPASDFSAVDQRLRSGGEGGGEEMGVCNWCGSAFPLTRSTRKYCTTRCKTNACLERKPSRIRAADVEALHELLQAELPSAELFRERLRAIIAPHLPPIAGPSVPRLD
jgi:hypothetical protein